MKRPILLIGCTFCCATWVAFGLSAGGAMLLSVALVPTAVLLHLLRPGLRRTCLVLLTAAAALGCYTLHDLRYQAPFTRVEGETLEVHGLVTAASTLGRATEYTVQARFPGREDLPDGLVVLRSYDGSSFRPGDGIRCAATVSTEKVNRSRGESLRGTIQGLAWPIDPGDSLQLRLIGLRERMQQTLYRYLPAENAGILGAVVLGLRDEIPGELYLDFSRAGTAHLLSVSGLHLSILTAAVTGLCRRLGLPRRVQLLCAIGAGFLFAGLAGFNAPIARAFVMTCLALVASLLSRRGDPASALGLALILLCVLRPYWVLGKGLWLSATSTLGIILLMPSVRPRIQKLFRVEQSPLGRVSRMVADAISVSLCAYVLSFPVFLLSTGELSLVSPVANLLAAPFVAPVVLGGAACALGLPGVMGLGFVAKVTSFCLSMVAGISRFFAALPFATIALDEGYLLLLLAGAVVGGGVLIAFRADRRLVSWALALLVLSASAGQLSLDIARRQVVELAVIEGCDVAVLLRGGEAVLLGTPNRYNIGRLTRYLDFRGVRHITAILAGDCPDNVDSGLIRIRDRYGIGCVIGPDDAYLLAMLESALPQAHVFSGGYATVRLLGGVEARPAPDSADLRLKIGQHTVLKLGEEYGIMDRTGQNAICLYPGGALLLPPGTVVAPEPMGRALYGETRLLLRLSQ